MRHHITIINLKYPIRAHINKNWGKNSNLKSFGYFKNFELIALIKIPIIIWINPKITLNFILKEFINCNSFEAMLQIGSMPKIKN